MNRKAPQGGPLSPLLANLLLDGVDKELERRGHRFVRYADDCNVYVRSKRAAERVIEGLVALYAQLKLRVNPAKSAVAPARERSFLGYGFWFAPGKIVKRRVALRALTKMKERIREITLRNGGHSLTRVAGELRSYLLGWKAYFRLADTPRVFAEVDQWLHRRLRMLLLKQWKARPNAVSRIAAPWSWRGCALDRRSVWPKLVACGSAQGASHRTARSVLRIARGAALGAFMNLNSPNRRMPTRMSGGVGGK